MKACKLLILSSILFSACSGGNSQDHANPSNNAEGASQAQSEPSNTAANALVGIWDYESLLPVNPDGSTGTDTTGLGMFHSSMIGTTLSFTDTICEMKGKMGNSVGNYELSGDQRSITLRRNGKEQVWSVKKLDAEHLIYSAGGMPIVVTYKRRH